jgi:hypothetical protein
MSKSRDLHPTPTQIHTFRLASTLIHIGSIAVLTTLLLLLSAAVIISYTYFVNQKRAEVEHLFSQVQENVDRRAYALKVHNKHLTQWQATTPSLAIQPGKTPLVVGDTLYKEYQLTKPGHYDPDMGQLFVSTTSHFVHKSSLGLERLLSILYILQHSLHEEDFFNNTYIVADSGDFISSIPHESSPILVQLLAMREQFHQLTIQGPAWTVINLKGSTVRANIAQVSRIELPDQQLGYLVSTQDIDRISHAFNGKGHYAISDQSHLIYTSPGFDTSLLAGGMPEGVAGETYLYHPKAKLLAVSSFQELPWVMFYTPTAANQFGIEWPITLFHIILYLFGLTLLFWLYRTCLPCIEHFTHH